ncbi:MAG TPA: cation-translocating P-type ATPase family protein [Isosphaeraceae bacterium]|jgi:Cu+-exporting ATPase|nr:cation-translocating P-type ATPase family protein [Isosphaeraceae bacterium]
MHREYHPADMHHLRAHAFEEGGHHAHAEDHRGLYLLSAVLGLLIGGDLTLGALGLEAWRTPFGVSLSTIAALLGGARIVYGALEALLAGRIGADVALAQACIAALVIGQPFVAAEVVFIALVGEVLEAITFDRTQRAIRRLLDQTPRTARVRREGAEVEIPAAQVVVGDLVLVRPGERVPVDGPVVAGRSAVDQSALTGESIPIDKGPGEPVFTGTVNQFGLLEVRAEKVGHETTLGQVLRLVAEAQRRKAPIERAADRYARYFLPVVEVVAGLTLLAGYVLGWPDVWLRTVAVLVVACPCALILATPAAVLASMAWLARHGVLIKGGAALERLAACDTFAFDKTGTLTTGRPELAAIVPLAGWNEAEVLRLAATAEQASQHPLAKVVTRAASERGLVPFDAVEAQAQPGAGVLARWRDEGEAGDGAPGHTVLVGNRRLITEHSVVIDEPAEAALNALDERGETPLLVAVDGRIVGLIGARDKVRPEAHDVVHDLKHLKITELAILTGDRPNAARLVGKKTHIKTVEAELLPVDKARWIQDRQAAGRLVAMVGDGINDAPALAQATVGIALGGMGADLAAEAGDIVVLGDPLRVLPDLVKLSRATVNVIRQNIIGFAFGLNAVAMSSAALGVLGPVPAAILHQAGSLLVLLNAMRLLGFGGWANLAPVRGLRPLGSSIRRLDDHLDPGPVLDRLLRRWKTLLAVGAAALLLLYATWGWTAIGPDEIGLVRQQGRYVGQLGPGLHLRWPPPFERVDRLRPGLVRSVQLGFRSEVPDVSAGAVRWESSHDRGAAARRVDEALLMTGDGQLVELAASAQYHLDPDADALRAYAFGAADADGALRPLAESAVRAIVGQRPMMDLLTAHRHEAERAATSLLQARADAYRLGIVITAVSFQEVHPPLAVVDAYRDVSRAESERQRRVNEGRTYQAERIALAKGLAVATTERAEADRQGRVTRASGEVDAFLTSHQARSPFPALTDHRLYWEAIASALAGKPKVVLDPARVHPRHLILTDFPLGTGPADLKAALPALAPAGAATSGGLDR